MTNSTISSPPKPFIKSNTVVKEWQKLEKLNLKDLVQWHLKRYLYVIDNKQDCNKMQCLILKQELFITLPMLISKASWKKSNYSVVQQKHYGIRRNMDMEVPHGHMMWTDLVILGQSNNLLRLGVDVYVKEARPCGKSRHCAHLRKKTNFHEMIHFLLRYLLMIKFLNSENMI